VPAAGTAIRSGDREIGAITSAVLSPALKCPIALGYVHRDFVEAGTQVTVFNVDQATPAVVTGLPFQDTDL
jgi:glycine cleavage system aminomethyltransferase T